MSQSQAPTQSNDAIAEWITSAPELAGRPALRESLEQCNFFLKKHLLVVDVPRHLLSIVTAEPSVFARLKNVQAIEIYCDNEKMLSVDPQVAIAYLERHGIDNYSDKA
ncbi:MAG: hypothetical protein AAGA75_28150 [Cyanobacteria bacterium P01_E01_bin.6]